MLEGRHYQNAYVCDDIEAAVARFRARGIVREPRILNVEQAVATPEGEAILANRLCFIWVGALQYELIEPVNDPLGIYANTADKISPLRFHHACARVDDWASFRERAAAQDWPIAMERDGSGDELKFLYIDARAELGHYLEYVWMTDARWEQLRAL